MKLFMILLGCRPKGRLTEQHDIFFGIGKSLVELIPAMKAFWPEAKGKIHIDAWREITVVNNNSIEVVLKDSEIKTKTQLFFINLGGYKEQEFEEYHYKIVIASETLAQATKMAKTTSFYKHFGFKGATSHIDDKYGIDVDEIYNVKDILTSELKEKYDLKIKKNEFPVKEDIIHIGYLKLEALKNN